MSEISDMVNIYRLGAEGSYFLIKGSVNLVLLLLQQIKKMQRADILSMGEVKDFEKFMKATEGRFQLLNIPTEDTVVLEQMKKDFETLHISYTILPDLNVGDGITTIAYDLDHTLQIEAWYRQFCSTQLTGGELEYERLQRLTEGQISIVNIPWDADQLEQEKEEKVENKEVTEKKMTDIRQESEAKTKIQMEKREESLKKLREDLKALHINFTILPDLNVGDKNIQIAYANADAPALKVWYENYQEDILKRGEQEVPFQDISFEEYMDTGKTDAKEYVKSQPSEVRQKIDEVQRIRKQSERSQNRFHNFEQRNYSPDFFKEMERRLAGGAPTKKLEPESAASVTYKKLLNDPNKVMLSIDKGNLSDLGDSWWARIPNTGGRQYMTIPKSQVFMHTNQKTYMAFFDRDKKYPIQDSTGAVFEHAYIEDLYQKRTWDSPEKKAAMQIAKHMKDPTGKRR